MPEDFLKEWLDKKSHKDVNKLARNALVNDRWDRKFYGQMLENIDDFMVNHERLCNKVDTGEPMWSDLFWMLWKVDPTRIESGDIRPDHLINLLVGEEAEDIADFKRLRYFAEGDDVASALACIDLREPIEQLFDKLEKLKQALEQIMKLMPQVAAAEQEEQDIEQMLQQWSEGFNPDEAEGKDLQDKLGASQERLDRLREALQEAGDEANAEADAAKVVISQDLKQAMGPIADNAENIHNQQDLWGDANTELQRLPAEERMKLARRMQNDRFKRLLDLIGPMRRIMEDAQLRRVDHARDEIYRITLGDDIPRVLPSELAKIHHPLAKYDFYRKLVERELPQYDMRGKEKVGKGEIIACLDNSGSMMGQKEMFGKAIAICALHLARKQKRSFYGIHFGSAHQIKGFDFSLDADFSVEKVIAYAEHFWGGGTDFMRPLSAALDQLIMENAATGKVNGDIMFITDGLCNVSDSWLADFKAEQERLQFRVYGFLIGGHKGAEPLESICDGRVYTIQDLLDPSTTRTMWGEL